MHPPDWTPALVPATALAVWGVRRALPWLRRRLPDWAVPLLATVLGALAAHLGLDASPLAGATAGLAATGAWATGQQVARARRRRREPRSGKIVCPHCGRVAVAITRTGVPISEEAPAP